MREDLGKQDFPYGIAVWDKGRRKFLGSERTLERMDRATEHAHERLWTLIDEWLRLTTDGNTVLVQADSSVTSSLGIPGVALPIATSANLLYRTARVENKTRGPDADNDDITSPLLYKITSDIEDSLAMENMQLARQVKALEAERDVMWDEVEVVRQLNTELLASRPQTQLNLPRHHRR